MNHPPLPEPYSHIYPMDEEDCTHAVCFTPSTQRGGGLPDHQPVFTADQMRQAQDEAVAKAFGASMRGVRVEGEHVVISVKGGNDAARRLCSELVAMIEAAKKVTS